MALLIQLMCKNMKLLIQNQSKTNLEERSLFTLPCCRYPDVRIRQKAIEWIMCASSDFLFNALPQLVEALRFEIFESSSLAVALLTLSYKDRRFAFEIYWYVNWLEDVLNSWNAQCIQATAAKDRPLCRFCLCTALLVAAERVA